MHTEHTGMMILKRYICDSTRLYMIYMVLLRYYTPCGSDKGLEVEDSESGSGREHM